MIIVHQSWRSTWSRRTSRSTNGKDRQVQENRMTLLNYNVNSPNSKTLQEPRAPKEITISILYSWFLQKKAKFNFTCKRNSILFKKSLIWIKLTTNIWMKPCSLKKFWEKKEWKNLRILVTFRSSMANLWTAILLLIMLQLLKKAIKARWRGWIS